MSEPEAVIPLPDECLEHVFSYLNNNRYHYHHCLENLSLVSKQFHSLTNRLRTSLSVRDQTLPSLPHLLRRFSSLTSLDLTRFRAVDLDDLLLQISHPPFPCLKSLDLSHHPTFPANGLRAFAGTAKALTSLTCSYIGSLAIIDALLLIKDCFPLLEELDLSYPEKVVMSAEAEPLPPGALPKLLRKVNLSGQALFLDDATLLNVCRSCQFLEELVIFECLLLTESGIASAIRERPGLRSISSDCAMSFVAETIASFTGLRSLTCLEFRDLAISDQLLCCVAEAGLPLRKLVLDSCTNYTFEGICFLLSRCRLVQHLDLQCAEFLHGYFVVGMTVFLRNLIYIDIGCCGILTDMALFALIRGCPLLSEIKMEATKIGKEGLQEDYNALIVNHHVKSLHLGWNPWMGDETIKKLSIVCPNLEFLDLRSCGRTRISEVGVIEIFRRCQKIRHLSLASCDGVKLNGMDFEVPSLEVLSLAHSRIDDETLSVVSRSFSKLLCLDLEHCSNITEKGVRQVVENCKQLREINLSYCKEVAGSVVPWMVSSRPSLRKIVAPTRFRASASQREHFLSHHGCLVVNVYYYDDDTRFLGFQCCEV